MTKKKMVPATTVDITTKKRRRYLMKLNRSFSAMMISAMMVGVLSACAPKATPAPESVAPALAGPISAINNPTAALNVAQAYYTKGYKLQNDFMSLHQYSVGLDTKFRTGIGDLFANNQACFASVASTESQVAEAVMGDPTLPKDSIIDVLATGGASVSGEQATSECVQLNKQIADYVISNRAAMFDARQAAYGMGLNYKAYLHDQIGNYIINDVVLSATNSQKIKDWMKEKKIGITDFTWFPTNDLQYEIRGSTAQPTCSYYMDGLAVQELDPDFVAKFAGHEGDLKSLYKATWNSNSKACTLYRWAAFDKMLVVPTSAQTQDVYGTGEDQGAFPTPVK